MKIYHAGMPMELHKCGARRVMLSFADADTGYFKYWFEQDRAADLFLDSGAHSVASRGVEISIDDYIKFCHEHASMLTSYVQLDVVGNQAATRENLEIMERAGLRPLPVYTAAAPLTELERLCERYDYIGLGGLRGREQGADGWRRGQLDASFRAARRWWPRRFHLFGIMSQWVLERYPAFTADSAAVKLSGAFGLVMAERHGRIEAIHCDDWCRRMYDPPVSDSLTGGRRDCREKSRLARDTRWRRSIVGCDWLEQYITDLWEANGVTWT